MPESQEKAFSSIVQGWMEVLGPTTASVLAARVGLPLSSTSQALYALESAGVVLQGQFTPGGSGSDEVEWCDRRLLARIHRLTLGQLRREIEAVTAADFIRFLFRWQHVEKSARLHGRAGVLQIIKQLQGLELPAPRKVFCGQRV